MISPLNDAILASVALILAVASLISPFFASICLLRLITSVLAASICFNKSLVSLLLDAMLALVSAKTGVTALTEPAKVTAATNVIIALLNFMFDLTLN